MNSVRGDVSVLKRAKGVLLDLDGTVYLGDRPLPGAIEFVQRLESLNRPFLYVTNNCSKNPADYSRKLTAMGIPTDESRIFTSGELAARKLLEMAYKRVFVLGTPSLVVQLEKFGVVHDNTAPQAVLSSFDLTLTYDRLLRAVRLVQQGLPLISTHPDLVCPTPDGPIPDSGLITYVIEATTGVKARYLGKPMVDMVDGAAQKLGLEREYLLFIGDRLYTDMRMAVDAGIGAVLVLSGETTEQMLANATIAPDVVAPNLQSLVDLLS